MCLTQKTKKNAKWYLLPDLPIMVPSCSGVSSDLNASFKWPWKKKPLLKVSEKSVENWKNAGKCALEPVCPYPLLNVV